MSRYADFLQIEAWEVINAGADLDQLCEPADHTKVPLSPVYGLGIFYCSWRNETVGRSWVLERQDRWPKLILERLILRGSA